MPDWAVGPVLFSDDRDLHRCTSRRRHDAICVLFSVVFCSKVQVAWSLVYYPVPYSAQTNVDFNLLHRLWVQPFSHPRCCLFMSPSSPHLLDINLMQWKKQHIWPIAPSFSRSSSLYLVSSLRRSSLCDRLNNGRLRYTPDMLILNDFLTTYICECTACSTCVCVCPPPQCQAWVRSKEQLSCVAHSIMHCHFPPTDRLWSHRWAAPTKQPGQPIFHLNVSGR